MEDRERPDGAVRQPIPQQPDPTLITPETGPFPTPGYVPHALEHELPGSDTVRLSVQNSGTQLNRHRTLNFSTGLSAVEDSENKRITVTAVSAIVAVTGNDVTVGASTTGYVRSVNATPTETAARIPIPFAGTVRNFRIRTVNAQPASGSLVFTLMLNGAATTVTVTVAAGEAGGLKADTSNSFAVAAGGEVSLRAVNNASSASTNLEGWSFEVAS